MRYEHFALTPPRNQLIGHRGIAALAPENTMASFRLAASQQINWIEFDVRLTKDHKLIIFHDDTLERTTNGNGYVYEHNLQDLLALDAGSWFSKDFRGERIPVFAEIFTELLNLGLQSNIEMKFPANPSDEHIEALAKGLCVIIENEWPTNSPLPLISSFEWRALALVRQKLPQVPIGFLSEQCSADLIEQVAKTPNSALHCDYLALTPAFMAQALACSVPVLAYTVNEATIAKLLFEQRIFGIFSDNPQALRNR